MMNRSQRQSQHGISLIELMISITLGLIILASLTTLFVNQSRNRAELDKSNRMIENGRYAMELLSEDFKLAGFFGELNAPTTAIQIPTTIISPCTTSITDMQKILPLHVGGLNAPTLAASVTTPPCGITASRAGSDIVFLRRASTDTPIAFAGAPAGHYYIQNSKCSWDSTRYVIDRDLADLHLRQLACTPTSTTPYADLRRLVTNIYFVDNNNNAGDGIPTLKVREYSDTTPGTFTTTPLVEGIEYLQVEYGLDSALQDSNGDGVVGWDGIADSYSDCNACTLMDWMTVVSVRINVLARNIETTPNYTDTKRYRLGNAGTVGPFNDRYKRHAYTQVVRLVNPSSRLEGM